MSPGSKSAQKIIALRRFTTTSLLPGSRSSSPRAPTLDTVEAVKAEVAELSKQFPPDIKVVYPYDTTPFVELSIEQVIHTLVKRSSLSSL
jgi:hypothetical protein